MRLRRYYSLSSIGTHHPNNPEWEDSKCHIYPPGSFPEMEITSLDVFEAVSKRDMGKITLEQKQGNE